MFTQEAAELLIGLGQMVEVPASPSGPFPDYGQITSRSWLSFLRNFKSADIYSQRLNDFFQFLRQNGKEGEINVEEFEGALVDYFQFNHDLLDEDGEPKFKGSQFRGWFSMFIAFWKHTNRGDLKERLPNLLDNLKKWEKEIVTLKAKTFTEQNLGNDTFIKTI